MHSKLLSLVLPFVLLTSSIFASWQDHWIKGTNSAEQKHLEQAIKSLRQASSEMSESELQSNPYVLIDLGVALHDKGSYQEALTCLNKSLTYKLSQADKEKAFVMKVFCEAQLDMDDQFLEDFDNLKNVMSNWHQIEETDETIIIRNYPDSECYKKIMTTGLIGFGKCEKEQDIQFLKNGTCVIKKQKSNGCPIPKHFIDPNNNKPKNNQKNCQWYCNEGKKLACGFCAHNFEGFKCKYLCLQAVDYLTSICNKCCAGGNFYENCGKVFADILSHIGNNCNPDMDP